MRLPHIAPLLAGGLILGWAGCGQAATNASPPPAAPIFYCPGGAKPVHPVCPATRATRAGAHHARRRARGHEGWREAEERHEHDVSASQAFIYRYERAEHGLDPRAADMAWEHPNGFWPHRDGDDGADHHRADHADRDDARADGAHDRDGDGDRDRERAEGEEHHHGHGDRHDGDGEAWAQGDDGDHDRDGSRHYGYERRGRTDGAAYGYSYERSEHRGSSGWVVDEENGRPYVSRWDDEDRGEDHHGRRAHLGAYDAIGEDYPYAGRDTRGYLVWPGKTDQ
ncbi:MAG: hypothetical protein ACHP84_11400 [Caulobacterales bacterium]